MGLHNPRYYVDELSSKIIRKYNFHVFFKCFNFFNPDCENCSIKSRQMPSQRAVIVEGLLSSPTPAPWQFACLKASYKGDHLFQLYPSLLSNGPTALWKQGHIGGLVG